MHKKNVEIYHCGWLTKSPPSPSPRGIWRARWRRRWFTLKQGELPGQFFLEYYTDQSCRKRKGIIDLDQVEQVDAGLRLDRQSIKFQHIFDMKTASRIYFMAADTELEMRDWVMVICQVCNLQETEEKNGSDSATIQYYNIGPNADFEAREVTQNDHSAATETTTLTTNDSSTLSNRLDQLSIVNEYENDNVVSYRQSEYSNRETLVVGESQNNNHQDGGLNYSNLPPMSTLERSHSVQRQSSSSSATAKSTGAIKKIPENLKLRSDDKINNNSAEVVSLYRSSGPYIPLSDCYSGSPVLFKNEPKTPLNSLDPKFYDTPRSHITNIGLNLTTDQPNSPKRNNIPAVSSNGKVATVTRSNNSTPTDSEGGSTDEEWTEPKSRTRRTRPSDSSMENEAIAITADQRYSKMAGNPIPLPPKRISLVLEKKLETSDTEENASPIMPIGPRDASSVVDDRYDFPRSYNIQNFTGSHMNIGQMGSMAPITGHGHLMTSTPNLIHSGVSTLERPQMNFYSNAAPRANNNIFIFDFAAPPPEVNRTLKPKKDVNGKVRPSSTVISAPSVDRKLKPGSIKSQPAINTNSLKRRGPETSLSEVDNSIDLDDSVASNQSYGLSPKTPNKCDDRLQYLDLDHTSSPQKGGLGSIASTSIASNMPSLDMSLNGSIKEGPGVAYTTVDFLKTDAFNRVREDSEMTRASKSRMKN